MPRVKDTPTVPASPVPDVAAIVAMAVRLALLLGGAAGFAWANMNAAQTAEIVTAITTLIGAAWAVYEPFRVQQHIDAAAKVSAQHSSARAYPHYKSIIKGGKLKHLLVGASLLALAGCGGAGVPTGDVAACSTALFAANSSDPAKLLAIALATPACASLAQSVIQTVIADVSKTQHARGVRQ